MRRRDFMQKSLAAAGLLLSKTLPAVSEEKSATGSTLSVVEGETEKAVRKALEQLGGMARFVKPGCTVLLKPNVSFPNPSAWGSTTSPEAVKTAAQMALEAGAGRVIVADNTMRQGTLCFDRSGLTGALSLMQNVKVLPIQQESFFEEISVPNGKALSTVQIARLARKADVLINMPCAKSHAATDVSFGLKNLMGLVWDRSYFHESTDLDAAIAELAAVIRPALTICDASRALLTAGPTGPGKVAELRTVIAGTDPVAVDAFVLGLAAWNNRTLEPSSVKHIRLAYELGLGELDMKKVDVIRCRL
jgi:uncharacterized protein (DUF362 family)